MEKSFSESYKEAGVDVTAGYKAVELMKKSVQETYTKGVMSDLGGFGGLFLHLHRPSVYRVFYGVFGAENMGFWGFFPPHRYL